MGGGRWLARPGHALTTSSHLHLLWIPLCASHTPLPSPHSLLCSHSPCPLSSRCPAPHPTPSAQSPSQALCCRPHSAAPAPGPPSPPHLPPTCHRSALSSGFSPREERGLEPPGFAPGMLPFHPENGDHTLTREHSTHRPQGRRRVPNPQRLTRKDRGGQASPRWHHAAGVPSTKAQVLPLVRTSRLRAAGPGDHAGAPRAPEREAGRQSVRTQPSARADRPRRVAELMFFVLGVSLLVF